MNMFLLQSIKKNILLPLLAVVMFACGGGKEAKVSILQMNDVYEIAPLDNGKVGGLARVATLYDNMKKENPNAMMVHAGDFLNPSIIANVEYEGDKIKGRQMVEVMNAMPFDYVVLGNHEFDLKYERFQKRMNESSFPVISSNVKLKAKGENARTIMQGDREVPTYGISTFKAGSQELKIGVIGLTLQGLSSDYVEIEDYISAAKKVYEEIKGKCDFVVAITHLNIDEDRKLAEELPELKLIMGGHEHENHIEKVGNTVIAKADANARTVYQHDLVIKGGDLTVTSTLIKVNEQVAFHKEVNEVVKKWEDIALERFAATGFFLDSVVGYTEEPLDGREVSIRNKHNSLSDALSKATLAAATKAVVAFNNAGSIRIDDQVQGKIKQKDILKILPFGGSLSEVEMKGDLLLQILKAGESNKGIGGFLHTAGVDKKEGKFLVGAKEINADAYYWTICPSFLLTGKEKNLGYFTPENKSIRKIITAKDGDNADLRSDVRLALMAYIVKNMPYKGE